MPATILSSSVASSPTDAWIEFFEYTPSDSSVLSQKGKLFSFVSMTKEGEKKKFFSQTLFNKLYETYYSLDSKDVLDNVKKASAEVIEILGEGQFFAGVLFESRIVCIVYGGASAALVRGGTYVTLVKSREHESASVSGFIKQGDVFLFGTHQFFETVTKDIIISSVSSRSPAQITEFLQPMLDVHNDGQIGSLFVKSQEAINHAALLQNLQKEERKSSEIKSVTNTTPSLADRPLYLKEHIPNTFIKPKRTPMLLGIVLVLILIGSMFYGSKEVAKREKENAFQAKVMSIQEKLDESQTLANINPERSRQLFDEAKNEVSQMQVEPEFETQIAELRSKIDTLQVEILGEQRISFDLFVDLSLLSDGFSSHEITSNDGALYILDTQDKKVARVSLLSKRAEIIAGPSLVEETHHIASYVDSLYGMDDTTIQKISPTKSEIGEGSEDGLLFAYAGNLYVVDKKESQIYRHSGISSTRQAWLTEGTETDLSDAKSLIIDGTIWILKENGEIKRFSGGNPYVFSLYGVYPEVKPTHFYTNEMIDNLYVLDTTNSRLIVATKGGEFITQYVADELSDARFIVVDEEGKKVFIVSEDKVYVGEMEIN